MDDIGIDTTLLLATRAATPPVGLTLVFNSIGWKAQTSSSTPPTRSSATRDRECVRTAGAAAATATITGSTVDATATSASRRRTPPRSTRRSRTPASSTAAAMFGATGKAVGVIVASNKVRRRRHATIEGSDVPPTATSGPASEDGRRLLEHQDRLVVRHDERRRAAVIQNEIDNFVLADFSRAGDARSRPGRPVRIQRPRRPTDVKKGAVYEWLGEDGAGRPRRHRLHRPPVLEAGPRDDARPAGHQLHEVGLDRASAARSSSTTSTATSSPRSRRRPSRPRSVDVNASEAATIVATNDIPPPRPAARRFTGQGQSLATDGVDRDQPRPRQATRRSTTPTSRRPPATSPCRATNNSMIEATTLAAMSSGAQSVGIELAFNTDRVEAHEPALRGARRAARRPARSRRRSAAADAPALTDATITSSTIDAAGNVIVTRRLDRAHHRRRRQHATSAPAAIMGAGGMSAAAILSSNMVNSAARASIDDRRLRRRGGDVSVVASDDAAIRPPRR